MYSPEQSQDANRRVQLDGDFNLQGNVALDIRLPLTRKNMYTLFVEGKDVILQHAIDALQAR